VTNSFKAVGLVVLVPILVVAYGGVAAADLQGCFRDGYVCSIKCDNSGLAKVDSARCQAQCNTDEKICLRKVADGQRPATPRYSSTAARMKLKPINTMQASASRP
jgi:hypothetical protein